MKTQVMGKGKRKFWLFTRRLFVACAAALYVALSCNSTITVENNGSVYTQRISPFDKRTFFEDSELFSDILEEEVGGLTRMAVIKSQLETEGTYNGQKLIDIAAYAHRQEELPEATVTAQFYLDDLVKWGNYGFVTEKVYATENELNSYFTHGASAFSLQSMTDNALIRITEADASAQNAEGKTAYSNETLSLRMISELPNSREEYLQMAERAGKYIGDSDILELDILVPRYLSAEGLDLAEYASSLEEYKRLRDDLKTTSRELFYNFTEYSSNKDSYSLESSNLRYCYRMMVDGEICYFSNLEQDFSKKKLEEITQQFSEYGKYIYYNADRSEIDTNTGLEADWMRQVLGYYQYAFGDNTRVWISVDTLYPAADGFYQAKEAYDRLMPSYMYLAMAFVLFLAAGVWLFVLLTRFEGRKEKEEGGFSIALHKEDKIRTEPFVLLSVLVIGGLLGLCWFGNTFAQSTWEDVTHSMWYPFAAGALMFVLDYAVMFFYLGIVRRIKAHTIWKNSLLLYLVKKVQGCAIALYDNSHILGRVLIPFILLLAANLVLGGLGIAGILTAAAVDIAAILIVYQEQKSLREISETAGRIGQGNFDLKIDEEKMHGENRELARAVNGIGDGIKTAVEKSMKDERLKADLITNVSHDIKTPLTSIINFVNLLKREKIENERIAGYINVLDQKSQRLKQLTDDLVEASKISSGNISLQMEKLNFAELVNQTCGEFSDKFQEKCLEMVVSMPEEPVYILADSRRIWRVVENLFSNTYKYALEGTRVYLDMKETVEDGQKCAVFSMKNISAQALNIDAKELTERFIRGDISRSTEGSGLGLSIAQNLTELQKGRFEIYLDGDLFKVLLSFPLLEEETAS